MPHAKQAIGSRIPRSLYPKTTNTLLGWMTVLYYRLLTLLRWNEHLELCWNASEWEHGTDLLMREEFTPFGKATREHSAPADGTLPGEEAVLSLALALRGLVFHTALGEPEL